eukprot:TRINITY_DN15198_c0_g1_i1.p1 TRINITY_DN15198_c0_g1~~TRINITY_DN15198_c0_g1_i1.p1  ORF type:complete len:375 (+),score=37.04 TRINITY_DN15198_c0_g1_i1:106-1125(+)
MLRRPIPRPAKPASCGPWAALRAAAVVLPLFSALCGLGGVGLGIARLTTGSPSANCINPELWLLGVAIIALVQLVGAARHLRAARAEAARTGWEHAAGEYAARSRPLYVYVLYLPFTVAYAITAPSGPAFTGGQLRRRPGCTAVNAVVNGAKAVLLATCAVHAALIAAALALWAVKLPCAQSPAPSRRAAWDWLRSAAPAGGPARRSSPLAPDCASETGSEVEMAERGAWPLQNDPPEGGGGGAGAAASAGAEIPHGGSWARPPRAASTGAAAMWLPRRATGARLGRPGSAPSPSLRDAWPRERGRPSDAAASLTPPATGVYYRLDADGQGGSSEASDR